jgi:Kinesin motor domain
MGSADGSLTDGIIPLCIRDIFARKNILAAEGATVEIHLSYMEVYNEECYDLMTKERTKLNILDNKKGESVLIGQTNILVGDEAEVKKLFGDANRCRVVAQTAMNNQSSRSHAICTLSIRTTKDKSGSTLLGKLYLVDLAGSERVKKTHATGEIFQQGVNINKGK